VSEFYPDIWRLQAQADIRGLIEAVKHASPDVRRRAVAALRALGARRAIPPRKAALVK
jgi:HEAT repeat protein